MPRDAASTVLISKSKINSTLEPVTHPFASPFTHPLNHKMPSSATVHMMQEVDLQFEIIMRSSIQEAAFKAACPIVKPSFLKPTRGETPVRSTQACFPPIHPKTKISAGLRVDLPSNGSVKKLTAASFLEEIPTRLNTSKRTSLTMSCRYLKPGRSLQRIACSPNESKHALRQIGHKSSTGKSGIKRRYLRMVRYSTGDICWPRPSIGIARRKF
ncbi:hypothetical protein LXL04_036440 [Taraxacum kok-saghyz]